MQVDRGIPEGAQQLRICRESHLHLVSLRLVFESRREKPSPALFGQSTLLVPHWGGALPLGIALCAQAVDGVTTSTGINSPSGALERSGNGRGT